MGVREAGPSEECLQEDLVFSFTSDHSTNCLGISLLIECLVYFLEHLCIRRAELFLAVEGFAVLKGDQFFGGFELVIQQSQLLEHQLQKN